MEMDNDYGRAEKNQSYGAVCDCGNHKGIGNLAPDERASRYERQRLTGAGFDDYVASWLKDYKKHHGSVLPTDHRPYIGQTYAGFRNGKPAQLEYSFKRCCLYGTQDRPSDVWHVLQELADKHSVGECINSMWVVEPPYEIRLKRAQIIMGG